MSIYTYINIYIQGYKHIWGYICKCTWTCVCVCLYVCVCCNNNKMESREKQDLKIILLYLFCVWMRGLCVCVCVSVKCMFNCLILIIQFFTFTMWALRIIQQSPSFSLLSHNPMRAISFTCSYFLNQFQTEFIRMHRSLMLSKMLILFN